MENSTNRSDPISELQEKFKIEANLFLDEKTLLEYAVIGMYERIKTDGNKCIMKYFENDE